MADQARRFAHNVPGDFFVDQTCIDCDQCREIAPATFRDAGSEASVYRQPVSPEERRQMEEVLKRIGRRAEELSEQESHR